MVASLLLISLMSPRSTITIVDSGSQAMHDKILFGGEIVGYLVKWDDKGPGGDHCSNVDRSHLDARLRKQRGPGYYHFHS
ncbi:hypothetical protein Scep_025226 [Stephania cephalantha]|uniref:Uncharacterized protein n=1 Tax=Stephania cephalantha TaxID=152367 RepID=A0AAP0EL79_9MAGN